MGSFKFALSLLALAAGSVVADDLPAIQIKGSKFFFSNGTEFFMKGVGYQQDSSAGGASSTSKFTDPLADEARCKVDVPLLSELGINIIRTYAIDPTKDHSACMKLLNDAGIYVVSDLSEPSLSINRNSPEWNTELFDRYKLVVDSLANYTNVLGFFAGNEVSNQANNTDASAYVKAAVRDTKAYISQKKYRSMGVGYAANDDENIRDKLSSYFNCGESSDSIDFFGYNIYSWCGSSDFESSGYNRFIEAFQSYSVPVFFAEYGCNNDGAAKRKFEETTALYTKNMSDVVSGGIVYEYFQEANDYGLVKVSGSSVSKLDDFSALKTKLHSSQPTGVSESSYSASNKAASCPTVNSDWAASSTLPPTPNTDACTCMVKSSSCVPKSGLSSDDSSQIFDYICGKNKSLCTEVNGNGTTGTYGTFSMCSSDDKLAYVLNAYYQAQNKASTACDFNGKAQTQTASSSKQNCTDLAKSNDTTSSGNSSSSSGSDNKNAATGIFIGGSDLGLVVLTALFGAAMLAL